MTFCGSYSDHVHTENSETSHVVNVLVSGLKEETKNVLEQTKRQVAHIEMMIKEGERLGKDLKNEVKTRDRHIRSTTVELQTLLKQMAITLIKQLEATANDLQSQINSKIISMTSDASKAKKFIEDVEGFLQLEDEQFLDSGFKNAQANLDELLMNCVTFGVPTARLFDMCIDYEPIFSDIKELKFKLEEDKQELELLCPTLCEEAEVEVCIGSVISKSGVFYAIQRPTVETVNKLRAISANIRQELMNDASWMTYKHSEIQPSVGTAVYVLYSIHSVPSNGIWYRGVVEEIKQNRYSVRCIDYGNLVTVDADALLPIKSHLFQKCAAQAFPCCLFDHLETANIPIEAKWYFGDSTKGSTAKCKIHKALTNESGETVWYCTVYVNKYGINNSLLNISEEVFNIIAEAGAKTDSISCRDIRYKDVDKTQPSAVMNGSITCGIPPDGATEVHLTTVANDSELSLPTGLLAVNNQPHLLIKNVSAKNTELMGTVSLNDTKRSIGDTATSGSKGVCKERYEKQSSGGRDYSAYQCRLCGEYGHIARDCMIMKCFNCHESGHGKLDCPQLTSYVSSTSGHSGHTGNADSGICSSASALAISSHLKNASSAGGIQDSTIQPKSYSDFFKNYPAIIPDDNSNADYPIIENRSVNPVSMSTSSFLEQNRLQSLQTQPNSLHFSNAGLVQFPNIDLSRPPPLPCHKSPPVPFGPASIELKTLSSQNIPSYMDSYHTIVPPLLSTQLSQAGESHSTSLPTNRAAPSGNYGWPGYVDSSVSSNLPRRPLSASLVPNLPSSLPNMPQCHADLWHNNGSHYVPSAAVLIPQHRQVAPYTLPSSYTEAVDFRIPPPSFDMLDARERGQHHRLIREAFIPEEFNELSMMRQNVAYPLRSSSHQYEDMPLTPERFPVTSIRGPPVFSSTLGVDSNEFRAADVARSQIAVDPHMSDHVLNYLTSDPHGSVVSSNLNPMLNLPISFNDGRTAIPSTEQYVLGVREQTSNETFQHEKMSGNPGRFVSDGESFLSNFSSGQVLDNDNNPGENMRDKHQTLLQKPACMGQVVVHGGQETCNISLPGVEVPNVNKNQDCCEIPFADSSSNKDIETARSISSVQDQYSKSTTPSTELSVATTIISSNEAPVYYIDSPRSSAIRDMYMPPSPDARDASCLYSFSAESCAALMLQNPKSCISDDEKEIPVNESNQLVSESSSASGVGISVSSTKSGDQLENTGVTENIHGGSTLEMTGQDYYAIGGVVGEMPFGWAPTIDTQEATISDGKFDQRQSSIVGLNQVSYNQLQSGSCFIGHVTTDLQSNGDFVMQLYRDGPKESKWVECNNALKSIVKLSPRLPASEMHVGRMVVVNVPSSRGDLVARAQILKFRTHKVDVRLIDEGRTVSVPIETVYDLLSKLMEIPPQALLCSVAINEQLSFSQNSRQFFADKVKGALVTATVFYLRSSSCDTIYHVKLVDGIGQDINALIYAGTHLGDASADTSAQVYDVVPSVIPCDAVHSKQPRPGSEVSHGPRQQPSKCYSHGSSSHNWRESRNSAADEINPNNVNDIICYKCRKVGHMSRECPENRKEGGNMTRNCGKGDHCPEATTEQSPLQKQSAKGNGQGRKHTPKNASGGDRGIGHSGRKRQN